jgi:hypothetical protein
MTAIPFIVISNSHSQNIEIAAEYYKFAADRDHPKAKLNYLRYLRLPRQWETPGLP